jgi:hypothetical protein
VYFGECPDGSSMTSGFRFDKVPIRRGERIAAAKMEFTADTYDGEGLALAIHVEPAGDSRWFTSTDSPGDRALSTLAVPWPIAAFDSWSYGDTIETPDLRRLVQAIVSRPDWRSGNAMTFLIRNDGPASGQFRHRRVYGFDRDPKEAARLIVTVAR